MTTTQFYLTLRFLIGFSVGLIVISWILLETIEMPRSTRDFVDEFGWRMGLRLLAVTLVLELFTASME